MKQGKQSTGEKCSSNESGEGGIRIGAMNEARRDEAVW